MAVNTNNKITYVENRGWLNSKFKDGKCWEETSQNKSDGIV